MSKIKFYEHNHSYVNVDTGRRYTSGTTIIGRYKQEFDSRRIAGNFIDKHQLNTIDGATFIINKYKLNISPKELLKTPITVDRLLKIWDGIKVKGLHKGNKQHFTEEQETLANETLLPDDYNENIVSLSDLKDGVYPELRFWLDKYEVASTADKVIIERPYFDIDDYKTNRGVLKKNAYGKVMKEPLNYLPDSEYYHYGVQLNLYAYIIAISTGLIPRKLRIIHKKFVDNEPIPEEDKVMFVSEEEQRKPVIYTYNYYPLRAKILLEYDFKLRQSNES